MNSLFIVAPIVEVCFYSMFCCTLLHVHSSLTNILMGKRELVAFAYYVFLVSRDCCVALPRGTMD